MQCPSEICRKSSSRNLVGDSVCLTTWEVLARIFFDCCGRCFAASQNFFFRVSAQRQQYKTMNQMTSIAARRAAPLTQDRIEMLNQLGFTWTIRSRDSISESWNQRFEELQRFKKKYGVSYCSSIWIIMLCKIQSRYGHHFYLIIHDSYFYSTVWSPQGTLSLLSWVFGSEHSAHSIVCT